MEYFRILNYAVRGNLVEPGCRMLFAHVAQIAVRCGARQDGNVPDRSVQLALWGLLIR
jgi:hypothetical protein